MERRRRVGRLGLGVMLVVAAVGPLGATYPVDSVPVALAAPGAQTAGGQVTAGGAAEVSGTEGDGLRVRAEPSLEGNLRAVLVDGATVQVLEGPVRADGLEWFRVSYDTQGGSGWVAGRFLLARRPGSASAAAPSPTDPTGSASAGTTSAAGPAAASTPASLALPSAPVMGGPAAPATVTVPASLAGGGPSGDPATAGTAAAPLTAPGLAAVSGAEPPSAPGLGAVSGAEPPSAVAGGTITTTPGRYVRLGAYPASSPEYGMNVFIWGESNTTQRDIDRLRELGFGWQKTLFQWREIEGQGKGRFDWREADRVVAATTGAGIKILARIDFPPEWAVAPALARAGNEAPPAKFEDYADFIRAFTTRYGTGSPIGRVHAIEVWNEPNLAREWGNLPVNQDQAGDYVRLLKTAYEAAKTVDPQMTIVTAGLTPTGTDNDDARPDDVYLQWIYDAGGAAYFDVLGAHGAGYRAPPNMSPDEVAADRAYGGHASFSFRRVEQLRDVMLRNGDDAKQVWLLEFGWTSDDVHPAYAWHRVTEDQKADYIVGAFRWANQNWTPWIGVMCLWNLAAPGWTQTSEEYFWSITNPDGSPRAAFTRLRDARRSGELP